VARARGPVGGERGGRGASFEVAAQGAGVPV
jgi:hypothetical protein